MCPWYEFTVSLLGFGSDSDEAWENAVEAFSLDPGETPWDFKERPDMSEAEDDVFDDDVFKDEVW
jgi:hypothetical protein